MNVVAETHLRIERLERLREWCVLAVWSPWLWAIMPLFLMLHAPSWTTPPRYFNAVLDVGMCILGVLLFGSIGAAIGVAKLSDRIEALCSQALEHTRAGGSGFGPSRRCRFRVRRVSGHKTLVVRSFAPIPVRWTLQSLIGAIAVGVVVDVVTSWPPARRDLLDLLLALGILAIFFGPAWLLATWIWVARINLTGHCLRIVRTCGPWKFGPVRARAATVSLPCAVRIADGGLWLVGTGCDALVTRLPRTNYGMWQGLRLRHHLEIALQMPLPVEE